ncbi:MAG: hypothetical protein LBH00_10115 [Planctomycetaceae bacterium]|nr:hypothetical protein [Planctomycetaceae bacterium]
MKEFVCEQCGECCRYIDKVEQLKHLALPNGVCKHLNGNFCDIYETRPDVCDYTRTYKYFRSQLTEEQYHDLTVHYCSEFKNKKLKRDNNG